MGVLAVSSKVMSKLTVALLAALICIILADVSGEQQSIETDTLSEVLSDHKLVKREADPGREKRRKKKKKAGKRASKKRRNQKKKCRKGAKGKDCRKARKQAKKGGKSGKGGNAKKRRTNQKKCPKGKKGKKCRRARKRSNNKGKWQKENGRSGAKKRRNKARQGRQLPTCFEKMYKYTSKMKKANNIQKQFLRVNGSKGVINNKKDKKGSFNGTLSTLTTALGGNKTNPKCAASSRAFNSTLDTLDKCDADIEASCTFSVNVTIMVRTPQLKPAAALMLLILTRSWIKSKHVM